MQNLFSRIRNSNRSSRLTHGTFNIDQLVRSTLKEVKAIKDVGGLHLEARQFSSFVFDYHKLGVHAANDEIIEDKSDDYTDVERRLNHIAENHSAYIESEKKEISEKLYRLIDKLAALVQRMKSQIKEHNSYNS